MVSSSVRCIEKGAEQHLEFINQNKNHNKTAGSPFHFLLETTSKEGSNYPLSRGLVDLFHRATGDLVLHEGG
ncbi:hypothetical protein COCNU_06G020670 [Cocos nucifera]|uniref:Uncharacterized protein n=1 Tax=Cocos nucifera TaxID=13894 RepID=A0A8K0IDE2_COCNU|nr:hypothetical protein COCNU_06G020670 [Cocos nucifera]